MGVLTKPENPDHVSIASQKTTVLTREAKRALADALGERYVSDDPAVIASHSWAFLAGETQMTQIRPVAVVLPANTQEVQAVVRICLRHGLRFRAMSTGTASFHRVTSEGVVSIDLRRMDQIVHLDAANQMAVIEPYVTAQQLMAESLKVGLVPHVIGAGWTHSPLASATSLGGIGITGNHTGFNVRNLLSWEWVTPEGEIVRGGSAGSGAGWYAGEGPGPGFRGMLRGSVGAASGLGVFTRIGYKLHPWAGPERLEHVGPHPQYGIVLNDKMRLYQPVWETWEQTTKATYELMISNAAQYVTRLPPDHLGWNFSATNQEFCEMFHAGTLPEAARNENRISWSLVALSETHAEAEWRDRVIRSIVEKTGGRLLNLTEEEAGQIARNVITSCYSPRAFRSGPRQVSTSVGVYDSFSHLPDMVATGTRLMAPYKNKHKTFAAGSPEEFWIWPTEGRHLWGENIVAADNETVESAGDAMSFIIQTMEENDRRPIGFAAFALGDLLVDIYCAKDGANQYMRRIKALFDPHDAANGMQPSGKVTAQSKIWPLARIMFRLAPWLLRRIMRKQLRSGSASKPN
jgi:glycolate oxidase